MTAKKRKGARRRFRDLATETMPPESIARAAERTQDLLRPTFASSAHEMAVGLLEKILLVHEEQANGYKHLIAACHNEHDDGSQEWSDIVRIAKRKARLLMSLEALLPLPTGTPREHIGAVESLGGPAR